MEQVIPTSVPQLLARGEEAIGGLKQFEVDLELSRVTSAIVTAKVGALRNKRDAFNAGSLALKTSRNRLRSLVRDAVDYLQTSRDVLKTKLGKQYSAAWIPAGFPSGFAVAPISAQLQERVYSMSTFLADNPTYELPGLNMTSARGESLFNDLKAARNAVNLKMSELDDLRKGRDTASKELQSVLRQLVRELGLAMGPLDERWIAFGLNKPGAKATPDAPENVTATLNSNNTIAVKWPRAPRARYYRVSKKVDGVDQELIAVGSPTDANFTIEGLPANATIEIAVSAVNDSGESVKSQVVTVQT